MLFDGRANAQDSQEEGNRPEGEGERAGGGRIGEEGTTRQTSQVMDGVLLQEEAVGFGVPEGFKGELSQRPGGDDSQLLGVESFYYCPTSPS